MITPRAFAHQNEFAQAVEAVRLPEAVVSLTPTLGTDWNGESAVFFHVVLKDSSVPRSQLLALTRQISEAVNWQVLPMSEWGVLPYFSFQMESESGQKKEPVAV